RDHSLQRASMVSVHATHNKNIAGPQRCGSDIKHHEFHSANNRTATILDLLHSHLLDAPANTEPPPRGLSLPRTSMPSLHPIHTTTLQAHNGVSQVSGTVCEYNELKYQQKKISSPAPIPKLL